MAARMELRELSSEEDNRLLGTIRTPRTLVTLR